MAENNSDLTSNKLGKNPLPAGKRSSFPLLENENERLDALYSYHILDTTEEKDFDDLTALASVICQTPIALVSLVDKDRQWFKSHKGLSVRETARDFSFCAHAIISPNRAMIITDATKDKRFSENPLVTGETNIVFYAGIPLVSSDGFPLGSLCVIDHQTRALSDDQVNSLTILAKQVIDKLELRRKIIELDKANEKLKIFFTQLEADHQKLNESELKLRSLILQAPVAIAILKGPEHLVESANEKILKIWGKDKRVVNKPFYKILPAPEGDLFLKILRDVYTSGISYYGYEAKTRIKTHGEFKDGYFNFVYQPLKDDAGVTHSIIIIATEITEQVVARKEVSENNALLFATNHELSTSNQMLINTNHELGETQLKLKQAMETGKMGSWSINPLTFEVTMSDFIKELFGFPLTGKITMEEILLTIDPEYRQMLIEVLRNAILHHLPSDTEYSIIQRITNERKWVKATGKIFYDSYGVANEYSGMFMDITERKLDELRKNDFIGMVSHELKTPLTSLYGYIQILNSRAEKAGNEFFVGALNKSALQVKKMTTMINGFLNISRLNSGKIALQKQSFKLDDLISITLEDIKLIQLSHTVTFIPSPPLTIFADLDKIGNVISNLISNAIKYSPVGSSITIQYQVLDNLVQLSVQDEGMGIKREDIVHLFERYYRVENENTHLISGFGIGLYLCAEIIKIHDGKIWAESEIGKGSVFHFSLPL